MRAVFLGAVLVGCHRGGKADGVEGAATATPASTSTATSTSTSTPIAIPPPYDLPSDLTSRQADASPDLGPRATFHVVAGVFLFAAPGPDPLFDAGIALAERALPAFTHDRFPRLPDRAVTVFLLRSDAAYAAFCTKRLGSPCAGPWGEYHRDTHESFVDLGHGATTLTHELVHPLMQRDFPAAPMWLDEGIASLYETPDQSSPLEIHGKTNGRALRLHAAFASPAERASARLDALFATTDEAWKKNESLGYAVARYACKWLDDDGKLWPFYRAFRDGRADDPRGEAAFARVVGKTPAEANEEWMAWAKGQ